MDAGRDRGPLGRRRAQTQRCRWWAAPRRWLILAPGCLSLLLTACEAKLQTGSVRISGPRRDNHWKYLSKFGYGTGTGTFSTRVLLSQPRTLSREAKLQLEVYLDENWADAEGVEEVCERRKHAKQVQQVTIKSAGGWSDWVNGTLTQKIRPHIWYFVLSDCESGLDNYTHRVKFEFRARQDGGSEFSIEMRWMLTANALFLLGFTVFTKVFIQGTMLFFRSAGSVHPVIWVLAVGMAIQYVAQVFHFLHLWFYRSNGSGVKPLEVISEILFMMSQVSQTTLLILIALGYTLLQSHIGELDLMIPVCFMVGVIHIMLVGFGKIKDDASYKYHENEGPVGWILMSLRLLLYVWFVWAVQSSAAEGGMKLRSFLLKFRAAGTVYFLSYPAIFLVTKCFAPYLQHSVMTIGLMSMQAGSNTYLASLFLTRGEYFSVSTLSASELPGGTKVGMVKEE